MPIFGLEPTTSAVAPDLLLTRSGRASAQISLFVLEVIAKTAKELAEKRALALHGKKPPTVQEIAEYDEMGRRMCVRLVTSLWGEGAAGFEWEVTRDEMLPAFLGMMHDAEAEVRTAAAFKVTAFAELLPPGLAEAAVLPAVRDVCRLGLGSALALALGLGLGLR